MKNQDKKISSITIIKIIKETLRTFLYFIAALILGCFGCVIIIGIIYDRASIDSYLKYPHYEDAIWYELHMSNEGVISINEATSFSAEFDARDYSLTEEAQRYFSEQEFIGISEVLLEKSSEIPLENWQVKEVSYHLYDCEKGFSGYVYADYSYEYPVLQGTYYDVSGHKQALYPDSNYVGNSFYTYQISNLKKRYYSDFDETYPISATEAFEIAEEHKGKEVRSQEDNRYCEAIIVLDENNHNKWHIWYTGKHGVIFEGVVDRRTGWFKRIRGKKLLYYLLDQIQ